MVLTSDHGQEFWDHGCFGHIARFYDELLHILLILFGPRIRSQVNRSVVSQLDIAPTILNFYRTAIPEGYRGYFLLSTPTNRFIISEASHNEEGVYIMGHEIFPSKFRTYAIEQRNGSTYIGKNDVNCII